MAKPKSSAYQEGKKSLFSARLRRAGHEVYVSGFRTKSDATEAAEGRLDELRDKAKPFGDGPRATTLAEALQQFGMKHLKSLKGAPQEARRINKYLRAAGLEILEVKPVAERKPNGAHFTVALKSEPNQRTIPNGLHRHRRNLLSKTATSDAHRAALATQFVQDIQRYHVQDFIGELQDEGMAPATVALERALLRGFFNYAKRTWKWASLTDNPAQGLKLAPVNNGRTRTLSDDEKARLDEAVHECRNALVGPALTLLRETAMRASEPLERARWGDVDWARKMIRLTDSKTGPRDVPLSPAALNALEELRALGPSEPEHRLVTISYEALRAAFKRACQRAGIADASVHVLRHTGATDVARASGGNIFLVMGLTGHKTIVSAQRYVQVGAADVVEFFNRQAEPVGETPEKPAAQPAMQPQSQASVDAGAGATMSLTQEQLEALLARAAVAGAAAVTAAQSQTAASDARTAAPVVEMPDLPTGRHSSPQTPHQGNVVPIRKAA